MLYRNNAVKVVCIICSYVTIECLLFSSLLTVGFADKSEVMETLQVLAPGFTSVLPTAAKSRAVSVTIAMLKHASHPSGGRVISVLRCVPNVTGVGDRVDFAAVCMLALLLETDCSLLTIRTLFRSPLAEGGGIVRAR